MLIPGFATAEGTQRFRDRFGDRLPGHFRSGEGLWLSSIGLGTYLGEPTPAYDELYREAISLAVGSGVNVIDSAINYRHQRSERDVGWALRSLMAAGTVARDEVVVATKGGFLSFDEAEPADPTEYFSRKYIEPGIIRVEEVAAGCHIISPRFLADQIETSRLNLGVETIDIYYLHNPETQLNDVKREEFVRRLKAAFTLLEKAVGEEKIRFYGLATWNAFRVGADSGEAVSLPEVLRVAEDVAGKDHHFRALQLPFNLAMPEALLDSTQEQNGKRVPVLHLARTRRLMTFASATLLQGRLTSGLPQKVQRWVPHLKTDAQRAIQFVRSTPGITCALVGMCRREHVLENLGTASHPPLSNEDFRAIFRKE
jgi:aryl-alcohol dehydrogenase-like predicted oxidoreductase